MQTSTATLARTSMDAAVAQKPHRVVGKSPSMPARACMRLEREGSRLDVDDARAEHWREMTSVSSAGTGVKQRKEVRGEPGGILVIDDFAHPTAVGETIVARYPGQPQGDRAPRQGATRPPTQ